MDRCLRTAQRPATTPTTPNSSTPPTTSNTDAQMTVTSMRTPTRHHAYTQTAHAPMQARPRQRHACTKRTRTRTLFYFPQTFLHTTGREDIETVLQGNGDRRRAPVSPRATVSVASPSNPLARGPSTTTGSPYHCSWLPQNGPTILSFNHQ